MNKYIVTLTYSIPVSPEGKGKIYNEDGSPRVATVIVNADSQALSLNAATFQLRDFLSHDQFTVIHSITFPIPD